LLFIVVLGLFFGLQSPAEAAGPYWRVWLHEPSGRHMTMVEDTGAVLQDLTLPLPDLSYSTVSRNVGISHDGNLIAYFLANDVGNLVFELYDVAAMTMYSGIYTPPVTTYGRTSLDILGGSHVFSPDDRFLAITVQIDSYWEMVVIDTVSRTVVSTLRSSDSIVTDPTMSEGYGLPTAQKVDSTSVHFTYVEGMEGAPRYRSFVWQRSTNTLTETSLYPHLGLDRFETTGEELVAYQNEAYPNRLAEIEGIPIQMNVVQVNTPTEPSFVWFNNESSSLSAIFVENGQRVLVRGWDAVSYEPHWALYERDLTTLHSDVPPWSFFSAAGVGDGFIYVATDLVASGEPALIHHDTTAGTLDNLASVWVGTAGMYMEIAWLEDVRFELAGDFMPWEHFDSFLAEAPLPSATPLIAATSSVPLGITVGIRARIVTTEGDMLNVRSGSGTSFALLYQFANDTRVTLLEGPIASGGFNWWRVRADDGREGWVVDFADGVSTLVRE
jgi:hypothetical protein